MSQEKIIFQSNGAKLVGLIDLPNSLPAPGVLMLHGGTNTKDNCPIFSQMIEKLNRQGVITFRFDFYGSGESDGLFQEKTFAIMDQNIKDALELFSKDKRVTKIGLLSRSQSGAQTSYFQDDRIKARVVHSGGVNVLRVLRDRLYPDEIKPFLDNIGLGEYCEIKSDPRKVKGPYAYSRTYLNEAVIAEKKIRETLPKLNTICFFQGDADLETDFKEVMDLYTGAAGPKELHMISGVGHKYEGAEDLVAEISTFWFKKFLF